MLKIFFVFLLSFATGSSIWAQSNEEMFFKSQELENKLKNLTAQFENMEIKNRTLENELKKTKLDYEFRLKELEDTNASLNTQVDSLKTNVSDIKKQGSKVAEPQTTSAATPIPTPAPASDKLAENKVTVPLQNAASPSGEEVRLKLPSADENKKTEEKPEPKSEDDLVIDVPTKEEESDDEYGGTPNRHYQSIHAFLDSANYTQAETAIRAFIAKYPNHVFTPNAYYWLGETFYVRKMYDKAALAFADAYKRYPNHEKSGANILKIGFSMDKMGKKFEACQAFNSLIKGEVITTEDILIMAKKSAEKLAC